MASQEQSEPSRKQHQGFVPVLVGSLRVHVQERSAVGDPGVGQGIVRVDLDRSVGSGQGEVQDRRQQGATCPWTG